MKWSGPCDQKVKDLYWGAVRLKDTAIRCTLVGSPIVD